MELEVEYQDETIGKYNLDKQGEDFVLVPKQTDGLAKIKCNIPQLKQNVRLGELVTSNEGCCTPGGGCC